MESTKPGMPDQGMCTDGRGRLPGCAPLANPFVPYQPANPQQYQPAKGLIRGTMFPGLDLPFMGMVNSKEKPKTLYHQLQSLAFAMTELGLYLDTHQDDREAMELFSAYHELYGELAADYEKNYGPLRMHEAGANGVWDWTKNPWPWDYNASEED